MDGGLPFFVSNLTPSKGKSTVHAVILLLQCSAYTTAVKLQLHSWYCDCAAAAVAFAQWHPQLWNCGAMTAFTS